jgi:hypothetical protein
VTNSEPSRQARQLAGRPEPVRHRGDPFFDQLVAGLYSPALVRRVLYQLVQEQYEEADRISGMRGWGGAQPHGNDRYQYSLEQEKVLSRLLPGAGLLRPKGSLLYRIADAVIYPMRYGTGAADCPMSARIDDASGIQQELAGGWFYEHPTLFDPDPRTPPTVVWLLFTGNFVEGGPLASYLAQPGGALPDGRVEWLRIEPLLTGPASSSPEDPVREGPKPALPAEPMPKLRLRT